MELVCPDCHSESLKIKPLQGWERLIVFLSDLRKYGCNNCGLWYRARERRSIQGDGNALGSPWAATLFDPK